MKKIALIGIAAATLIGAASTGAMAQGVGVGVGPGGVYVGADNGYRGDRYYNDRGYRNSYNEYRDRRDYRKDRWDGRRDRGDRVYIERY